MHSESRSPHKATISVDVAVFCPKAKQKVFNHANKMPIGRPCGNKIHSCGSSPLGRYFLDTRAWHVEHVASKNICVWSKSTTIFPRNLVGSCMPKTDPHACSTARRRLWWDPATAPAGAKSARRMAPKTGGATNCSSDTIKLAPQDRALNLKTPQHPTKSLFVNHWDTLQKSNVILDPTGPVPSPRPTNHLNR